MSEDKPLSIEKCENCKRLIHRSNNGDCPYCKASNLIPPLRSVGSMSREQIKVNSAKVTELTNQVCEHNISKHTHCMDCVWNAAIEAAAKQAAHCIGIETLLATHVGMKIRSLKK